jgi:hypothetical protein
VHVAALWRSEEAVEAVRRVLVPGGALYVIDQAPGWRTEADARAAAEQVAESVRTRGFGVDDPIVGELDSGPVVCVVARPAL